MAQTFRNSTINLPQLQLKTIYSAILSSLSHLIKTMTILRALLLITLFLTVSASASATAPAPAPVFVIDANASTASASEFIRNSCEATLYPDICYHSLSGYASAVQQDPARLAAVAVAVSLSSAARMAAYLANLSRGSDYGADPQAAAAVRDCFNVFDDAVDQIRGSLRQMRRLTGTGEMLQFQISNVQTWMSAALTNEDTCVDGFEGVANGAVKADVCDRTVGVKKETSNALALVNGYVHW